MKFTITGTENGRELVIHDGVTEIDAREFANNHFDDTAFAFNKLKSLTLPDGVVKIGDWAFEFNQLRTLIIPASVTWIGQGAFRYNNLKEVYIPNPDCEVHPSAFDDNVKIIRGE
jgi:hypothetical protein